MDSNYVKLQEFVGQIGDLSSLCFCREIQLVQTMLEPAECRRLGSICYYHAQHAFSSTCMIGQVHLLVPYKLTLIKTVILSYRISENFLQWSIDYPNINASCPNQPCSIRVCLMGVCFIGVF